MWNPFRRKEPPLLLTREQSLDALPMRNAALRAERSQDGLISIIVPFRPTPLVARISRWLKAPDSESLVKLDEIGTFVWDMCDGETPVREMISRLAEEYKLSRKEAQLSLTAFLSSLARRRLIAIIVAAEGDSAINESHSGQ